MFMYKMTKT